MVRDVPRKSSKTNSKRIKSTKSFFEDLIKRSSDKAIVRPSDLLLICRSFRQICRKALRSVFGEKSLWEELKQVNPQSTKILEHIKGLHLFICPSMETVNTAKKEEILSELVKAATSGMSDQIESVQAGAGVKFQLLNNDSLKIVCYEDITIALNKKQIEALVARLVTDERAEINRLVRKDMATEKFLQSLEMPGAMGVDTGFIQG
eukprot:Nk52_evm3s2355 gene=Nk52_evmTU3s2355